VSYATKYTNCNVFLESRQYTLRGQMRCKGRHYFVCACTVLFSLCSMCLTTTPRHNHFTSADFNAGGDRVVSQPEHRVSRVTFVAGFLSDDGKYGRVKYEDATIRCLLLTSVSTCFGHHYAYLQENKGPVTAFGVLFWFFWMWLVAVDGRCLAGCDHYEDFCSTEQKPS